jgi:hypothetical protein
LPEILNVRGSLFGSDAVGVQLYGVPTVAVLGGVPLITGAELVPPPLPDTRMLNAGSEADETPSVTAILM